MSSVPLRIASTWCGIRQPSIPAVQRRSQAVATMTLPATPVSSGTSPDARFRFGPELQFAEGTDPRADDVGCDVCQHSLACHDAIGLRFCRATVNGAITRGCVCRSA